MNKILICGLGNIGTHIMGEFHKLASDISIYDKYDNLYSDVCILDKEYEFAFICVPTEMNTDGSADISEVDDIVSRVNSKNIIIKSAVPVGTAKRLSSRYNKNIVISPEYYGTTRHSENSPAFVILGGDKVSTSKVAQLYSEVKDGSFRCIFTDTHTAELAKYMENCWIATKVTFCNEFASIAERFDVSYEQLRECFIADSRVSPSHTYVYPEHPYYNSHCLNKDIPALIQMCNDKNIETPLIDSIKSINDKRKIEQIS